MFNTDEIQTLLEISKGLDNPEFKKKLLEILSKYNQKEINEGYLDLCHKIQVICKNMQQKNVVCINNILENIFKFIITNDERKIELHDVISKKYLKTSNSKFYLFESNEDIDCSKLTIDMLDNKEFSRKDKGLLGFKGKESIEQLFKKSSCKLLEEDDKKLPREKVDLKYRSEGTFLTNFCRGLKLDIDYLFYDQKYFNDVEDYDEYVSTYFTKKSDQSDSKTKDINKKMNPQYIQDSNIVTELNISTVDLEKILDKFTLEENVLPKYDLKSQNPNYLIKFLEKSFLRGIDDEKLLEFIEKLEDFDVIDRFIDLKDIILQHKAKILSNFNENDEATEILKTLMDIQEENTNKYSIDSYNETVNLLAASYKRKALSMIEDLNNLTEDENQDLILNLQSSRDIYQKALLRSFNDKYYPAINISYLELMIGNLLKRSVDETLDILNEVWKDIKINITNYWSWVTDLEKNILFQNYSKAKEKIEKVEIDLDFVEIEPFYIKSTIRQLELYSRFADEEDQNEIKSICKQLQNLLKN